MRTSVNRPFFSQAYDSFGDASDTLWTFHYFLQGFFQVFHCFASVRIATEICICYQKRSTRTTFDNFHLAIPEYLLTITKPCIYLYGKMKFNIHNKTWAFHQSLRLLFILLHIYYFLFSTSFDIGLLQNLWFFRNDKCLNYISYGFFILDTTLIFILYFKSRTISLQYFILHHYLFSSFSHSSAFTFRIFSLNVWANVWNWLWLVYHSHISYKTNSMKRQTCFAVHYYLTENMCLT